MSTNYKVGNTWRQENNQYLGWILAILGISIGLLVTSSIVSGDSITKILTWQVFIVNLELFLIPVVALNVIYAFKRKLSKYCTSKSQFLVVKILGLIIGVLLGTSMVEYLGFLLGVVDDDYIYFGGYKLSAVATNFVTNQFIGLIIGVPMFLRQAKKERIQLELQQKEMELRKARKLNTQSELETLQAKINPHFLYNSLNSIVSLIHEDPDKAEKMVLSLSDLFRYSINSKEGNYSTIEEELSMVRTYLEIEHVRFQDQLHFEILVDPKVHDLKIPKFLIQPLIENAIKHGTSKIKQGEIRLEVKLLEADLHISVFDNGSRFPIELNSGYGLKSTIDKLEILYKDGYHFQLVNEPEKHLKIELKNIHFHESNR